MIATKDILLQKLQRTLLSEKQKQKVVYELKILKGEALEKFARLLNDLDQETLDWLKKKLEEGTGFRRELRQLQPMKEKLLTASEWQEFLFTIFSDPQKMAEVIVYGTDEFLALLEDLFIKASKNQNFRAEFQQFFDEMRLYKAMLDQKELQAYREALMEYIFRTQQIRQHLETAMIDAKAATKKKPGRKL